MMPVRADRRTEQHGQDESSEYEQQRGSPRAIVFVAYGKDDPAKDAYLDQDAEEYRSGENEGKEQLVNDQERYE